MNRIKTLESLILDARNQYYNDESTVTDQVFDAWVDELKTLDPENKAITNVGAPIAVSEWSKCNHKISMGSLDKVNTEEELKKWYSSKDLFITEKLDGISINCEYENGELVRAITRGNGIIGEDIVINVSKMIGVKKNIYEFTGSLRGEIILTKEMYNKHFKDKANTRNAASGISKRLDGVGSEYLSVLFYSVYGKEFKTEEDSFKWMLSQGLHCPNYMVVKDVNEACKIWNNYQLNIRATLGYDIDGLVVRYNNLEFQNSFGFIHGRPKGARAFKFDNIFIETILENVVWQVGNSGRLTPIAHVKPVNLLGTTVQKASIYNIAYIKKNKLTIGAKILVTKANDVIPRVEQVVDVTDKVVEIPTKCLECHSELQMKGEYLTCINSLLCPAQTIGKVKNWISGLGILEWGNKLIEKLIESGLVNEISDLYKLSLDDLSNLERMGEKSAKNCLEQLNKNKEITLDVFLGSLSISMNGKSSIKMVMSGGFNTLNLIKNATIEDFKNINGMGEIKAQLLYDGLIQNNKLISDLIDLGIVIKEPNIGKLQGSFCFSGKFSKKKDELEKLVSDNGGEVKDNVTKSLNYLVINDINSSSGKSKKAKKLNISILSESDFFKLLE